MIGDNRKSRPTIVKFEIHIVIYSSITKPKSRYTSTTESFKKKPIVKLTKAREQHGFRNIWTSDVTILVKIEGNYSSQFFYD